MLTKESFESEVRGMFNDICIVHDHQMGRVVGIHMDAVDYYYVIQVKQGDISHGRELPEGGREYYASAVGHCSSLRDHERYKAIEKVFTLNGCPPAEEFIISIDDRPFEEVWPEITE